MLGDALGAAICYDELAGRICVRGTLPWEDGGKDTRRPWSPMDDSCGYAYAQEAFGCTSERDFQHALSIVADKRRANPVASLLNSLPEWDGEHRVGGLMAAFLGAEDDDYTSEVERLLMGAALARTFDPGCKFDYMPVLIGSQGIGKATFVRMLALDATLYTDSLVGIGTKQAAELVQGKWFVELPELAAMKGAALEAVKAFITRQADECRMPYARHVESRPRRFVMVGTTNVREFLSDLTGKPTASANARPRRAFSPKKPRTISRRHGLRRIRDTAREHSAGAGSSRSQLRPRPRHASSKSNPA